MHICKESSNKVSEKKIIIIFEIGNFCLFHTLQRGKIKKPLRKSNQQPFVAETRKKRVLFAWWEMGKRLNSVDRWNYFSFNSTKPFFFLVFQISRIISILLLLHLFVFLFIRSVLWKKPCFCAIWLIFIGSSIRNIELKQPILCT